MPRLRTILCLLWVAPWLPFVGGCGAGGGSGPSSTQNDPVSALVYQAVNAYRTRSGKRPLTRHKGLDQLARDHSRYLMEQGGGFSLHGSKVSHFGFEGRVLAARRLYAMDSVSENVAAAAVHGSGAGESLLAMWKRSTSHHNNLLEDWTHTGVGSARGPDGTVYSTQLFANKEIGLTPLRDRMTQGY